MSANRRVIDFVRPQSSPPLASLNGPGCDRIFVGAVLLSVIVSQVVAFALGLWHPTNDLVRYIEAHRRSWWAWHTVSGMVFVMTAGGHAALAWWLVPARGRILAIVGGLMLAVGIGSFGAGLIAEAATHWYTNSPTLTDAQSHELLAYLDGHDGRLALPIVIGQVLVAIGPVLLAAGLWRGQILKRWLIAVFAISSILGVIIGPASLPAVLIYAAMCLIVWQRFAKHAAAQAVPAEV